MAKKKKNIPAQNARDFFGLVMLAFVGFGLDYVLVSIESFLYKTAPGNWSDWKQILHWLIMAAIWALLSRFLIQKARQDYHFDISGNQAEPRLRQAVSAAILAVVGVMLISYSTGGFKPVLEFQMLGLTRFIAQYIYYFVEAVLITLVIVFGQHAGELGFKKPGIPWGGYLLALTWGLIHFLVNTPSVGLFTVALSVLFGLFYLLMNKNVRYAFFLIALVFLL
jgi:hypothetical protein